MAKRYLILILILSIFVFPIFVNQSHAQVLSSDVVLSVSPQYPSPNQNVTATLSSHTIDLDKADISWSVNNQQVTEAVGKKVFYFTAGALGSPTNLIVVINSIDGQSIQKTATISPTGIDMLWEADDSSAPPFYRGRTLVANQGTFKVVAMPALTNQNGKINPNNLSYAWGKDGDAQPDSSGWGKNSFIFQNSYLDKSNTVQVKVSDITGSTNATGLINLQTFQPEIVFYENDPNIGVKWESALDDNFKVPYDGKILLAEPYFFSPKNINSTDLTFNWFLNGGQIATPNPKNMLAVKPGNGQSGSAEIKVMINNNATLFQNVEKILNVNF